MGGRAHPAPPPADGRHSPLTTVGVVAGLALFTAYAWLWLIQGEAVGAALVLGPLLAAVSIPVFARAHRIGNGFDLAGLLLVSLVIRFGAAFIRYKNAVDAIDYHVEGVRLARFYRVLDFGVATGRDVPGTGAMRAISGAVHVLVFDDNFGSFLFLAWLGFLGCWFLFRAFDTALDSGVGDRRRYAVLVFLWPSMCFWPSSLGKDAWMLFTIGLTALGIARVYRRVAGGYTILVVGLLGASFVRPHLALLALVAFVVAFVLGRRDQPRHVTTPSALAKVVGIGLVLVVGSVLVSRTQQLLAIEDFSASSLESASEVVTQQSFVGGSAFTPPNPRSPAGFVEATITVLFRPFPTEAPGAEQLFSSIEGLVLAGLTLVSVRRLATIPRRLRAQPYVTFALTYVLLWILAFGVIANFGILARQRTQMLPFYFVLLSMSALVSTRAAGSSDRPHARQ